ncbi:hypothetical protein ACQP3L_33535, partial [Escherichia coli]
KNKNELIGTVCTLVLFCLEFPGSPPPHPVHLASIRRVELALTGLLSQELTLLPMPQVLELHELTVFALFFFV